MKSMLLIDLVTMRKTLVRMCLSALLASLFIAYTTQDLVTTILACGTMFSYMYLITTFSVEENNGWAQYRLTLPLTRRQVVLGRYLSVFAVTLGTFALLVLVTSGAIAVLWPLGLLPLEPPSPSDLVMMALCSMTALLAGAALVMPFVMRLGFTRGSRAIALALVMLPPLLLGDFGDTFLGSFLSGTTPVALFAGSLVLYVASALLSVRLYETREL